MKFPKIFVDVLLKKSKKSMFFLSKNVIFSFRKTNGKIHSNTNDLIDVKVILNDDFANQSVTCLADLLYTK